MRFTPAPISLSFSNKPPAFSHSPVFWFTGSEGRLQEALKQDRNPRLPRALGIVVRQLREKQNISRAQLSDACGLSARFLSSLERGRAYNATITQIVRLSIGLNCPVTDLVNEVVGLEAKLRSE